MTNQISQNEYGCEFIDDGNYGNKPYLNSYRQPWRNRDDAELVIEVSVKFIDMFLDKRYIQEIRYRDKDYISELISDINDNGLKEPLELFVDDSYIRFQDGHHRYIACVEYLGYKKLPMIIKESNGKIKARSLDIKLFIPEMIRLVSIALDLENA